MATPAPMSNPGSKAPGAGGSNGGGNQPVNNQMAPAPPTNPAVTAPYDPDANPYYGQTKAGNVQIQGGGTGGTGTDTAAGTAPAAILSTGLAQSMGLPVPQGATSVNIPVPSGTTIQQQGNATIVTTPPVGKNPAVVTTVVKSPDGTTTTKSDTGTIVTTPSGAVTVTPATPPTVNPVNKTTDNYYVFTNSINTQEVDVSASQWNSWTPQQQFNFLKSIGALVPNDITANNNATFVSNKDGTWSITTPQGSVYTSVPAFDHYLLDYLRQYDPQVYSYVQQNGNIAAMNKYGDIITGAINVLNAQGISTSGSAGLNVSGIQSQEQLQTYVNNMPQDLQSAYYDL